MHARKIVCDNYIVISLIIRRCVTRKMWKRFNWHYAWVFKLNAIYLVAEVFTSKCYLVIVYCRHFHCGEKNIWKTVGSNWSYIKQSLINCYMTHNAAQKIGSNWNRTANFDLLSRIEILINSKCKICHCMCTRPVLQHLVSPRILKTCMYDEPFASFLKVQEPEHMKVIFTAP